MTLWYGLDIPANTYVNKKRTHFTDNEELGYYSIRDQPSRIKSQSRIKSVLTTKGNTVQKTRGLIKKIHDKVIQQMNLEY